jgi:hypothetical protein
MQRNAAQFAHLSLLHQLGRAFDDAVETRVADKHVMRFFGEHELAGARQGLETGFGER